MDASTTQQKTGKRALNRRNNRRAILTAALHCFTQKGYDNVTIRDIVKETDLAAGTFYNYFSSKQDIFAALLTDFVNDLNETLTSLRRSNRDQEGFIQSTYHALFLATARAPLIYELAHQNDRAIRSLFGSDILNLAMVSLTDDVKMAVEQQTLPNVDQALLCAAFFGVAYELGMVVARRAAKQPEAADIIAHDATVFATNLFLGGLYRMQPLS
ncbi:MAG: TetR/AcrR family transcriptional regulator [Marinobacter sp.]|nr:TetR/AcrR family transcriptional regulator [Marinobacter sp.]